ncbi:MAG: DinB family protein [Acidobacteriota bacterium]|nr:DinB family protein [Acidobacteriota bacterium]
MDRAHLQMLFGYTRWANARTLEAAAALSDEPFQRDLHSSFPSVGATLSHIAAADWIWLERWHGRSPSAPPAWFPARTAADLRPRWEVLMDERDAFLAAQTDAALAAPLEYANMKGERSSQPLWQQLQHVVNHATYHRGQVTTLIRQLGGSMVSTDLVAYLRECPYDAAARRG